MSFPGFRDASALPGHSPQMGSFRKKTIATSGQAFVFNRKTNFSYDSHSNPLKAFAVIKPLCFQ